MSENFTSSYTYKSSENVEEFFKLFGATDDTLAEWCKYQPNFEISKQGDKWTIKTIMADHTDEINFELGKQFDETLPDGIKVKTTIVKGEGRQLIQTQTDGKIEVKIVRDFNGPEAVNTATVGSVQAKWFYTKNA
ncbi:fatty acid-binding protein Fh15-like [Oppia nitens]|uniref:fatty acid-binding protein Fh15-like n=1 Tax=Oppia nitens TaxID=1686743 RepID=UPI0023DCB507|nr:fatty acid-binding protein Fh15-like [Oppia nitens]